MILDRDGKEAKHSGENGEGSAQVHFENYKKKKRKVDPLGEGRGKTQRH